MACLRASKPQFGVWVIKDSAITAEDVQENGDCIREIFEGQSIK